MKRYLIILMSVWFVAGCASEAEMDLEQIPCGDVVCDNGLFCCDQKCVDVRTSNEHCGRCSNACPGVLDVSMHVSESSCINRTCEYTCAVGYSDADGLASNGCEISTSGTGCGNHIIDPGEVCDSEKLNGWTCEQQLGVPATGVPGCNATCTGYLTGTCVADAGALCNNEKLDSGEPCDGERLNGMTCASVVGEGSYGKLACQPDCSGFDTTQCSTIPGGNLCGNSNIDSGELCDGLLLNGKTCAEIAGSGYTGNLRCKSDCKGFDTSGCTKPSVTTCNLYDVQCDGLSLQMCDENGDWIEIDYCETACSEERESCLIACDEENDHVCMGRSLYVCHGGFLELEKTCTGSSSCDESTASCQVSCQKDARRCDGKKLYICHDNGIGEDEIVCDTGCVNGAGCAICSSNSDCISNKCNTTTSQCVAASSASYYMTDFEWMTSMIKNSTKNLYTAEYIQPNTSGYTLKVHGRANVLTDPIPMGGQAVMINGDADSYIEVSNITKGVGFVLFNAVGYTKGTKVYVTAGMTQTSYVAEGEIKPVGMYFNNNANKLIIRADHPVTIDDFGWTTMK